MPTSDSPSEQPGPARPLSADQMLPPVEPPSPGFILQLFVIPGVIVVLVVLVWLLFNWLASGGDDPRNYFAALRRSGPSRWQAAASLADALRGNRHADFKADHAAASELAGFLAEQIDEGSLEEHPVTLRVFLCRALGEFHVDDGLPVLLRAAREKTHPCTEAIQAELDQPSTGDKPSRETAEHLAETGVRRAAVEAIALLSENVRKHEPPGELNHAELPAAMTELAGDESAIIRSAVAFALGVIDRDDLRPVQERLLADPHADVRYNAATGLARRGDPSVVDVLLEMLDPAEEAGVRLEKEPGLREQKRALITINGLRAAQQWIAKNPDADRARLVEAIRKLKYSPASRVIALEAAKVLLEIEPGKP